MGFNWKRAAGLPPMTAAYGVVPDRERLRRLSNYTLIEPRSVHENPRFYKYSWRIWALDNTDDAWDRRVAESPHRIPGFARAQRVPTLCFADAIRRMQALVAQRSYFYALMDRLKRADPAAPWQPAACRAPAYDDDMDESFHGHR